MEDKNQIFQSRFIGPVKNTGMITMIIAALCLFVPGLYLYIFHGLIPPFWKMVSAIVAVWSFMAIMAVVEPIVYYPVLGFGGTYMSFLVGNVLNLRVPVSATAQQVVGTKEGTPEAEIVSTLGIAGSVIGSQLVMIVGVLAFLPFITALEGTGSAVKVALDQVLPALFGALGGVFLFRVPKLGIVPLGLGLIVALINPNLPFSIVIPPMVILSIIAARIMYNKKWVKGEGMM
jgi:hypothetical protein